MNNSVEIQNVEIESVRVRVLPDGRMSRKDAAAYLGAAENSLRTWGYLWSKGQRRGPRPIKIGGRVFYLKADCDAFIAAGKPKAA